MTGKSCSNCKTREICEIYSDLLNAFIAFEFMQEKKRAQSKVQRVEDEVMRTFAELCKYYKRGRK